MKIPIYLSAVLLLGKCRINLQVGKPEVCFAWSLWRLCLDHGQAGSNLSRSDSRHYFRLADHSSRIVGSAPHRCTVKSGLPHVRVGRLVVPTRCPGDFLQPRLIGSSWLR
jgi:hypothetical protein